MTTPSWELGVQLDQNWANLKRNLLAEQAQRLIENFDLVYGIARGEIVRQKPVSLKPVASGVAISGASAEARDCFVVGDGVFAYRDSDFDIWLPKKHLSAGIGHAISFELVKELNFKEMVETHLGITGSIKALQSALIKEEKTWSLKQIDDVIRKCESGENPLCLRTDGYANIFFVEADGEVFAVSALRSSDGWGVGVRRFGNSLRWRVGDRVSFRN